jgi:hypothetical protein
VPIVLAVSSAALTTSSRSCRPTVVRSISRCTRALSIARRIAAALARSRVASSHSSRASSTTPRRVAADARSRSALTSTTCGPHATPQAGPRWCRGCAAGRMAVYAAMAAVLSTAAFSQAGGRPTRRRRPLGRRTPPSSLRAPRARRTECGGAVRSTRAASRTTRWRLSPRCSPASASFAWPSTRASFPDSARTVGGISAVLGVSGDGTGQRFL